MPDQQQPGADQLAGDEAGSDLGPGAPAEASAHEEGAAAAAAVDGPAAEPAQSPLSVAGVSSMGPPVEENPAADPGPGAR